MHSRNKAHNHHIKLRFSTICTSNFAIKMASEDRLETATYDGAKKKKKKHYKNRVAHAVVVLGAWIIL